MKRKNEEIKEATKIQSELFNSILDIYENRVILDDQLQRIEKKIKNIENNIEAIGSSIGKLPKRYHKIPNKSAEKLKAQIEELTDDLKE